MRNSRNNAPQTAEINKAFSLKMIETLEALQLLRDAVRSVRDGKEYHLAVLSGQMRSLLIDKKNNSEPRLFFIADSIGMPLNVFCMPRVNEPAFPLNEVPIFWASGFPISVERQLRGQDELSFADALNEPFILYDGVKYTPRTIIEWFANKAGGSHYSSSMPRKFAEMLTIKLGSFEILKNMLLQFAEAAFQIGLKFVRSAVQQEIHVLLGVPDCPNGDVYLIDAVYPDSQMRFSLLLNGAGAPVVRVSLESHSRITELS